MALPVKALRTFLAAQASAVTAKPFTCPAFQGMNKGFTKLSAQLPKMAMPGIGDLLGVRVSLDSITPPGAGQRPSATGRLLIASDNPEGLLALLQSVARPLSTMSIKPDGKPVAVPPQLTRMSGQPGWIAMTAKALAIGVGTGEDTKLAGMLQTASGDAGDLLRVHLDGAMYAQWLTTVFNISKRGIARQAASANPEVAAQATAAQKQMELSSKAALAVAKKIESMSVHMHMGKHGLVIDGQTTLH
jgi:hypothetical protein